MSFLVLHVPGGHFLPSSHGREWSQPFVLNAATTKHRHSAACSLSTTQTAQTTDAWKSSGRPQGKGGGQGTEVRVFLRQREPQTLFNMSDVLFIWKIFKPAENMKEQMNKPT